MKEEVRNGENGAAGRTRLSCAPTALAQFLGHGLNRFSPESRHIKSLGIGILDINQYLDT